MSIYLNKTGKKRKGLNTEHCLKLLSSSKYNHKLNKTSIFKNKCFKDDNLMNTDYPIISFKQHAEHLLLCVSYCHVLAF